MTFLNEKQEGVVVVDLGNQLVRVEIEDGFLIDIHERELAVIYGRHDQLVRNSSTDKALEMQPMKVERHPLPIMDKGAVYLISIPADKEAMMSGPVSLLLKNGLTIPVLIILYVQLDDGYDELFTGKVDPGAELFVCARTREELRKWKGMKADISLVDPHMKLEESKHRAEFKILLPDLNPSKIKYEKPADYSRVMTLYQAQKKENPDLQKLKMKFEGKLKGKTSFAAPAKWQIETDKVLEVDLHIDGSAANAGALRHNNVLDQQLYIFRKELNKAIVSGASQIIFIHGVGEGILRNRLILELEKHSRLKFSDAPENKYGKGALQVDLL